MSGVKTLAIAAVLLAGASSFAMAQGTMGTQAPQGSKSQQQGSTAGNAASSGGPGTHAGAMKTGIASSNQKVLHNQNGYQGQ
jgi:hypothetical protein